MNSTSVMSCRPRARAEKLLAQVAARRAASGRSCSLGRAAPWVNSGARCAGCTLLVGWLLIACEMPRPEPGSTASPRAPEKQSAAPLAAPVPDARDERPEGSPAAGASPRTERTGQVQPAPELAAGGALAARSELGMVVSVEAQATRAGTSILEAGGNAIDAAVATLYALAVTHPSAGNLGGGGFMLIARPGEPTVALDFRERAPAALDSEQFAAMLRAGARGPAASAVPGSVAGLNAAHEQFGRMDRQKVLAPAIRLASKGHRVGPREALTLSWNWQRLERDPEARRIFGAAGRPLGVGALLVRTDLAKTLERIAAAGNAGFYAGVTARDLVRAMGSAGLVTGADLAAYRAVRREPIEFDYRGLRVATMPPPSSGGVAIRQILLALQQLRADQQQPGSAEELHLLIEVSKRAQAFRRLELVDPDAAPDAMSTPRLLERFSPALLWTSTPPFDPSRATPSKQVHPAFEALEQEPEHTTHVAVMDAEGNAVSCTTTLSSGYGAAYVAPGTGVVMNNSLPAFGRIGLNLPRGGRRMLSSMAPTLVSREGKVVAVLGSPGGDTIPSTVVQILRHLVDDAWTVDAAIEAPRIHHGFVPDVVRYERARPPSDDVLAELRRLGHVLEPKSAPIGDAKNIVLVGAVAYGHADTREGGLAAAPRRLPRPP